MMRLAILLFLLPGANGVSAQEMPDIASAVPAVGDVSAPLDLRTSQRIALRDNPSLLAAKDRVEQAQARMRQARAAFWPSLDARASYSETWLSDGQIASQKPFDPSPDDSPETYQAGLEASWLLFNGFGRRFQNAAARFGVEESEASRREARRLLAAAVAGSFFAAQLAWENSAIAEADEAFNQRQLQEAQVRRRVGTGSLSDELNFEIRVNEARGDSIRARLSYRLAVLGLAALLALPADWPEEALVLTPLEEEKNVWMQDFEIQPLLDYALAHRPDVVQSRMAVERLKALEGVRRSVFLPSVSAFASESGSRGDHARLQEGDFSTTVGVAIQYNLFSGGRDRALLEEARSARSEAQNRLESSLLTVTSEVRQAAASVTAFREQLDLQRANTVFVRKNRDLVEKEYMAGQVSLVRLNEAQRDLIRQQGRLALARVALRQAGHDLRVATGEIVEELEQD